MTYVLVGVDGSDTSLRAVDWAAQHAQRRATALQIRSCYTVPFYGEPGAFASYAVESQVDALKLEHEEIVSAALGRVRAME